MDEDPVEILVSMAERGEIDPWNIDIVEVTDRFLEKLEHLKQLDLRVSGRTLFYAATLLRMKSELLGDRIEDDEIPVDEDDLSCDYASDLFFEEAEAGPFEQVERLEREIQRRIGRKRLRERPVTLFELITQLKTAEKEERRRHRRRRAPEEDAPILAEDIVGLAHDEGYERMIEKVLEAYEQCTGAADRISLRALSTGMGWTPRDVYIPLLFLMLEGRLILWQDDFFGEIFVGVRSGDADTLETP